MCMSYTVLFRAGRDTAPTLRATSPPIVYLDSQRVREMQQWQFCPTRDSIWGFSLPKVGHFYAIGLKIDIAFKC